MAKKVYLLGAGAAFLYGAPSTSDLTKSLAGLCPLNMSIHKCLEKYIGPDDYYFETLLSALEFIITDAEQRGKESYHFSIAPALSCLKWRFRKGDAKRAYLESINYIIDQISSYSFDRYESKDDLVFHHFTGESENHIYSLNYDRIIPEIFHKKNVSFSDGTTNGSAFNQNIRSFVSDRNTFFNVHGSIYLYQEPLALYDVFQGVGPSQIKYLYPIKGGNPRERSYFTPIISGYSKTQHIMSKPFSFGVSALAADLQDCDELEIIGYSFSDVHINGLLDSFFDFKKKELTVVDYFPKCNFQNRVEALQEELSVFYKNLPDNYHIEGEMLMYHQQKLRVFPNGVQKFLQLSQVVSDN